MHCSVVDGDLMAPTFQYCIWISVNAKDQLTILIVTFLHI